MSDFNDSMEEELVTREEMLECGRIIGATHALICLDSDPGIPAQVVYVSKGQNLTQVEKDCWRSSYSVETIKL